MSTSCGALDRNTLFCRVPDRLAGESQEKQREMYWKEKRRQLGLNEEWKGEKKRACGRKCATQLAKKIKMLPIHLVQQTAPPRCLSKGGDFTLHLKGSSLLMKVGGQLQLSFHGDCLLGPDAVIRSVIPRHALSRKYRPSFSRAGAILFRVPRPPLNPGPRI